MLEKYYSEFIKGHGNTVHMSSHSHHFWPDSAKEGHLLSFQKSAELSDNKWDYNFGVLIPTVQKIISSHLNFSRPSDISFAPNTHDLISKVLSSFVYQAKVKILTSKSEFHSLSRQLQRLNEESNFQLIFVDPESKDFNSELNSALDENTFDLIMLSHVFFNSGLVLSNSNIENIISKKGHAHFLLDAYHGYCAIPTNIRKYEDELYYIAGGYKYAQSGEGMCFMTLPKNCKLRPLFTGWFSSFSSLSEDQSSKDVTSITKKNQTANRVQYDDDGMRFWGSTIDFTAFFRFRAVWECFDQEKITITSIHEYVQELQELFLKDNPLSELLMNSDLTTQGHFLTFQTVSVELAETLHKNLAKNGIMTDFRGNRLRFGFAPYHTSDQINQVKIQLKELISFIF